jgi:ribose/xylose/arabinose/galactoside ABC-type transport system permease subunit
MNREEAPGMNKAVGFLYKHRIEFAVLAVFFILIACFAVANPRVFLNYRAYMAVFTTLGASIVLVTANVFIVASGEMDLSFPSVVGLAAMVFAVIVRAGGNAAAALLAALATGVACGLLNGLLVTKVGLSSLVSTLGMNFLWRGFIMIVSGGLAIPLTFLMDKPIWRIFAGNVGVFPVQLLWGLAFALAGWFLFARHRFGGHVCYVGDNVTSAREMGIRVDRVKILTFMLMGFAAGFVGVLVSLLNNTFWPTSGDGYLLLILAAVFLGGTPTWGGIGTIWGAVIGAFILGFIETGIVAAGLTGFFTQFFYGVILILALISHRYVGLKKR